ncbi:DUF4123 domain-containing protein [Pseudomonas sp. RIT-PI-AD]|uniref:DUF4123 domain-containing protein n=1 Tax=Pseudomonas sp. RIT-PI-AD TaxID=3035294 RepID=UPI0021DABEF4|nr:DUF4123 domain-containing protein [Pseudomonas sp. RIT-PI-AD]
MSVFDYSARLATLMPKEAGSIYALVDASRHPRFSDELRKHGIRAQCLFSGVLEARLGRYAPYCAEFPLDGALAAFWFNHRGQGWRNHWGWLFQSDMELDALRRHFKKFTLVTLPDGSEVFWRFYDPRVFCRVIPQLNLGQHGEFVGDLITRICCTEPRTGEMLEFISSRALLGALGSRTLRLRRHPWLENLAMTHENHP